MSPRPGHVVACTEVSPPFWLNSIRSVYIYVVYLFVWWRPLGLFPPLAPAGNAAGTLVSAAVLGRAFDSSGHPPTSEIAGPCGHSVFNFLHNHWTASHGCCTALPSRQPHGRVLISPHLHQNLLFSIFKPSPSWRAWSGISLWFGLTWAYFSCAYWSFIYLLWRNVYVSPLPHFGIRFFGFSLLSFMRFFKKYILDINHVSDI